jgi:hypothetical protein
MLVLVLLVVGPVPLPPLLGRAAGARPLLLTPLVSSSLDESLGVPYELADEECKDGCGWSML